MFRNGSEQRLLILGHLEKDWYPQDGGKWNLGKLQNSITTEEEVAFTAVVHCMSFRRFLYITNSFGSNDPTVSNADTLQRI